MWLRVAVNICQGNMKETKKLYDLLSNGYYTHASPTLFNSGSIRNQLASCFLIGTDDSMDGITDTWKSVSRISKYGGGIGLHISNIRSKNSIIRGTNGPSSGIIPMLKVYNEIARYVNQGGKRKGSIAIYLEPHHADIMEFLDLRKNFGDENMRARDLFLAVWLSDLFMKQVEQDKEWYLMCPDECPGLNDVWGDEYETLYWQYVNEGKFKKKIMAREVYNAIQDSRFETGTPYVAFKDSVNRKSNHQNIGTIKSSNLCCEVIEYSDKDNHAVCNLASIALNKMCVPFDNRDTHYIVYTKPDCNYCYWSKTWLSNKGYEYQIILCDDEDKINELKKKVGRGFITFPQIYAINNDEEYIGGFEELVKYHAHTYDYDKLYDVAYTATKNLDKVIDINFYPTPETKRSNFKTRPLGLGIQGLADTLVLMKIPFESEEALELNRNIMETIYYASMNASCDMAKDRQKNMITFLRMYNENPEVIPEIYDDKFMLSNNELNELYHISRVNEVDLINFTENDSCHGSYSLYHGSPVSRGIL
jgi:ribonucleoside-diphosphate reductase alpha subunit